MSKGRFYGGEGTIHDTGHLDVVMNDAGIVTDVWFRCIQLPFMVWQNHKPMLTVIPNGRGPYARIRGIEFESDAPEATAPEKECDG